MTLRVIGNVAAPTRIRDLNLEVSLDEAREISEADFNRSFDLKKALIARAVRVERASGGFPKQKLMKPEIDLQPLSNEIGRFYSDFDSLKKELQSNRAELKIVHEKLDALLAMGRSSSERPPLKSAPVDSVKTLGQEPPPYVPKLRTENLTTGRLQLSVKQETTDSTDKATKKLLDSKD